MKTLNKKIHKKKSIHTCTVIVCLSFVHFNLKERETRKECKMKTTLIYKNQKKKRKKKL